MPLTFFEKCFFKNHLESFPFPGLSHSQGFGKVFCVEHATVSVRKMSLVEVVLVFKVFLQVKWYDWVFGEASSKLFGYFRHCWCWLQFFHQYFPLMGQKSLVSLWKVRLCSPLAAGYTILVGNALDYPQLLRLALPNTLHARISSVSFTVHISISYSDYVYVQNLHGNIQAWSIFSSLIAWRR